MPPETRRGPWRSRPGAVLHAAVSFWARGRPWAGTYLPFFIHPLYSTLERLDGRLIEAGRDLGANSFWTFIKVTLPLSIPGLMAASVITILPMFGDYYTNSYLTSGSPKVTMVGNQIDYYLREAGLPNRGASLVLILMAMLFVLMVYYLVTTIRQQRAAER